MTLRSAPERKTEVIKKGMIKKQMRKFLIILFLIREIEKIIKLTLLIKSNNYIEF